MTHDVERRYYDCGKLELRKAGEKAPCVRGYGAVFNSLSEPMFGFREQIAPGAFDGCLGDDVRALFNHDPNHILGRSIAGTLRLSIDERGLAYECDLPDTQAARDLAISIDRGDVSQSSFAFRVAPNGDTWDENEDGIIIRTITKMARLYDVSPVTYPAYPDTVTALRSQEAWRDLRAAYDAEKLKEIVRRRAEARGRALRLLA